jgi:hypothetical protein
MADVNRRRFAILAAKLIAAARGELGEPNDRQPAVPNAVADLLHRAADDGLIEIAPTPTEALPYAIRRGPSFDAERWQVVRDQVYTAYEALPSVEARSDLRDHLLNFGAESSLRPLLDNLPIVLDPDTGRLVGADQTVLSRSATRLNRRLNDLTLRDPSLNYAAKALRDEFKAMVLTDEHGAPYAMLATRDDVKAARDVVAREAAPSQQLIDKIAALHVAGYGFVVAEYVGGYDVSHVDRPLVGDALNRIVAEKNIPRNILEMVYQHAIREKQTNDQERELFKQAVQTIEHRDELAERFPQYGWLAPDVFERALEARDMQAVANAIRTSENAGKAWDTLSVDEREAAINEAMLALPDIGTELSLVREGLRSLRGKDQADFVNSLNELNRYQPRTNAENERDLMAEAVVSGLYASTGFPTPMDKPAADRYVAWLERNDPMSYRQMVAAIKSELGRQAIALRWSFERSDAGKAAKAFNRRQEERERLSRPAFGQRPQEQHNPRQQRVRARTRAISPEDQELARFSTAGDENSGGAQLPEDLQTRIGSPNEARLQAALRAARAQSGRRLPPIVRRAAELLTIDDARRSAATNDEEQLLAQMIEQRYGATPDPTLGNRPTFNYAEQRATIYALGEQGLLTRDGAYIRYEAIDGLNIAGRLVADINKETLGPLLAAQTPLTLQTNEDASRFIIWRANELARARQRVIGEEYKERIAQERSADQRLEEREALDETRREESQRQESVPREAVDHGRGDVQQVRFLRDKDLDPLSFRAYELRSRANSTGANGVKTVHERNLAYDEAELLQDLLSEKYPENEAPNLDLGKNPTIESKQKAQIYGLGRNGLLTTDGAYIPYINITALGMPGRTITYPTTLDLEPLANGTDITIRKDPLGTFTLSTDQEFSRERPLPEPQLYGQFLSEELNSVLATAQLRMEMLRDLRNEARMLDVSNPGDRNARGSTLLADRILLAEPGPTVGTRTPAQRAQDRARDLNSVLTASQLIYNQLDAKLRASFNVGPQNLLLAHRQGRMIREATGPIFAIGNETAVAIVGDEDGHLVRASYDRSSLPANARVGDRLTIQHNEFGTLTHAELGENVASIAELAALPENQPWPVQPRVNAELASTAARRTSEGPILAMDRTWAAVMAVEYQGERDERNRLHGKARLTFHETRLLPKGAKTGDMVRLSYDERGNIQESHAFGTVDRQVAALETKMNVSKAQREVLEGIVVKALQRIHPEHERLAFDKNDQPRRFGGQEVLTLDGRSDIMRDQRMFDPRPAPIRTQVLEATVLAHVGDGIVLDFQDEKGPAMMPTAQLGLAPEQIPDVGETLLVRESPAGITGVFRKEFALDRLPEGAEEQAFRNAGLMALADRLGIDMKDLQPLDKHAVVEAELPLLLATNQSTYFGRSTTDGGAEYIELPTFAQRYGQHPLETELANTHVQTADGQRIEDYMQLAKAQASLSDETRLEQTKLLLAGGSMHPTAGAQQRPHLQRDEKGDLSNALATDVPTVLAEDLREAINAGRALFHFRNGFTVEMTTPARPMETTALESGETITGPARLQNIPLATIDRLVDRPAPRDRLSEPRVIEARALSAHEAGVYYGIQNEDGAYSIGLVTDVDSREPIPQASVGDRLEITFNPNGHITAHNLDLPGPTQDMTLEQGLEPT